MGSGAPSRLPRARSTCEEVIQSLPSEPVCLSAVQTKGQKPPRRQGRQLEKPKKPWRSWRLGGSILLARLGDHRISPAVALLVLDAQEAALLLGETRVALRNAHVSGERIENPKRGFGVVGS